MSDHYLDCLDPDCPGCLPSDDGVRATGIGRNRLDADRRGLPRARPAEVKAELLTDADDYRLRSQAAREAWENATPDS